jgi:PhnB protein
MLRLTPFLLFDGNCAEAMEFYTGCFGGELTLIRLGDTPMRGSAPVEQHNKITYAHLKSDAVEFSATDWLHPTRAREEGNSVAMYVNGAEAEELRSIFDKLAVQADRENFVELKEMPFGLYGRMTDRYGVEWFFRGLDAETVQ